MKLKLAITFGILIWIITYILTEIFNPIFTNTDFEANLPAIDEDTLVYADPPYLITLGSYNDGKRGFNGWSEKDEARLLLFFDQCHARGAKIVISNILDYKGMSNDMLKE